MIKPILLTQYFGADIFKHRLLCILTCLCLFKTNLDLAKVTDSLLFNMFLLVPTRRNKHVRPASDPICPLSSKNIFTSSRLWQFCNSLCSLSSRSPRFHIPWQRQLQPNPNYSAFPFSVQYLTRLETNTLRQNSSRFFQKSSMPEKNLKLLV